MNTNTDSATRTGSIPIQHSEQLAKFFLFIEGRESHLLYELEGNIMDLAHTYVAEEDRGRQVAENLVKAALQYARDHRLKVIPSCSYIARYVERHPEWNELVLQNSP